MIFFFFFKFQNLLCFKKKFRSTSKEDIDQFLNIKTKISDLHLRKIQISFYFGKFRFASNEDANQFLF